MRFLLSCIAILATLLANFLSFAQACSLLEFILCCPQDAYEAPDDIVLFCTEKLGDEPCPDVEDIIWCCAAFDNHWQEGHVCKTEPFSLLDSAFKHFPELEHPWPNPQPHPGPVSEPSTCPTGQDRRAKSRRDKNRRDGTSGDGTMADATHDEIVEHPASHCLD